MLTQNELDLLAELLYPDVTETPEDIESRFPARELPEGAKVTRFAPSPTGFVHFGGMYQVMIDERLAHQSGGSVYLRIEDTDSRREVSDAAQSLIRTLAQYGVNFDEGAVIGEDGEICDRGVYAPYKQSQRTDIYHVFAKKLVSEGKAYPVFSTDEELSAALAADKKTENKTKDWEAEAEKRRAEKLAGRSFTLDDIRQSLAKGEKFVLRLLADGDPEKKIPFTDLVRGKLEIPENDEDFVLLKSDGVPTYHFAHAVDDHLMGTTHVVRGEEWLPSLSKHIMLFRYLGFRLPKYMHTAQIMRLDENGNKKKLSKRDMGARMEDYDAMGYPPVCVIEYIMTLLNSNYEEWHAQNPDKPYTEFPFSVKKMSASGALFDIQKLCDVSKNVISRMSAAEVTELVCDWAEKYDGELYSLVSRDRAYTESIFAIGRDCPKPRKDIASWSDVRNYIDFFFDELFEVRDQMPENVPVQDVLAVLEQYKDIYSQSDDQNQWFEKVTELSVRLGYAAKPKEYKNNPELYKGHVGDVSSVIRVAVTGKRNSPDLYAVMQILGEDRVRARLMSAAQAASNK